MGLRILGILLLTAVPYLLGCSNGAILVSKYILHDDVRTHGSGNAGLTNFYRVFGGKLTLAVIAFDVIKMILSILIGIGAGAILRSAGMDAFSDARVRYIAGMCCEMGHMFPVMFGFHGGKGILSGGTMAIMVSPIVGAVVWGAFLILSISTKYVSLGSIATGILYPIVSWFVWRDPVILIIAIITGGTVVFMHRANIVRLIHGNENKFSFHRKAAASSGGNTDSASAGGKK